MFRAAYHSSSGALTVFAASGLHTHVVTRRSQVWVGTGRFPLRLDYGRSPHAYVNHRLQIQLELLMMSGMPLETCWAFNKRWINKFYYEVAFCWLFLLSHTAMHGSMNIKFRNSTCFGQFLCPSSGVFHCTHSNGVYHTACEQDQDVPSWSCSQAISITSMTYTIAVCTVKNSWWWTEELSETCRVSFLK